MRIHHARYHVTCQSTWLQEIAGPLESSVSAQALAPVAEEQQADNVQQLCLQPSLALYQALQRYWPCTYAPKKHKSVLPVQ